MNDKFFDLKQQKQERIINAALKCFALEGYRHASTDDVVRLAGISKGLLFHYFTSKLGLYTFLYSYSSRFMLLEYSMSVKKTETDYFELTRQMEEARARVMKSFPYMQRFLNRAGEEECEEAAAAIEDSRNDYHEQIRRYRAQADYSIFERKADPQKVAKAVEYTIDGLIQEHGSRFDFTAEKLFEDISAYLDMFKTLMQQ